MDFDPGILKQLIEAFQFELDENLQMVSEKILFLETSDKLSEDSVNALNDLFRAFHTIKGSAHAVGLLNIASLAHNLEDLYSKVKKKPSLINSEIIDVTLEVISEMKKAFEYYLKNEEDEYELSNIIEKTNKIINNISLEDGAKFEIKGSSENKNLPKDSEKIENKKNIKRKIKI